MSVFLAAGRRERTPFTPISLSRQAGRFQPEYRAIREKTSFIELCKSPDLAAEVTVFAVDQLGVDAAIIFADILLVLEPLGIGFSFTKGDGPHIAKPVRTSSDIDAVASVIDAEASLGYVMEAIRRTKKGLGHKAPLIGFAGAPFTIASYVIEGGSSRDYLETKKLMYSDEGAWNALLTKITGAIASYLTAQVAAGADALQVFDSWVGALSPSDYSRYVEPHMRHLFENLPHSVPVIHFGTGNPSLYPLMKRAGGDVIGLDWRVDLGATWTALGETAVMGNMDPVAILAPPDVMRRKADEVLLAAAGRPGHVFNLGHGVHKESTVDQVRRLVDHVHEASSK